MNKEEKNSILLSQNDRAAQSLRQAYYINQARLEEDYEQWDANELSWIFQQFCNAEATIAKLRVRLNEDHPLQQARELEDWLTYPTKILNKQIQLLVTAVQDMKTPLVDRVAALRKDYFTETTDIFFNRKPAGVFDHERKPKWDANKFKVGTPIPNLAYAGLETHEQSKALYVHMNAVVNAGKRWLLEVAKKKGGLDYTNEAQFQEVVAMMDKHLVTQASHIERIKPMYEKNRNRWAYARFEEWDSFIKQVRKEYEFRKAIPMWKAFKSKVDRLVADFLGCEEGEKELHASAITNFFTTPDDTSAIWYGRDADSQGEASETEETSSVTRHNASNIYASDIIAFVRASGWIGDVDETLAKVSRVVDDNPSWDAHLIKPESIPAHPYEPGKLDARKLQEAGIQDIATNIQNSVYAEMQREKVFGPLIEIGCLAPNYTEHYREGVQ